MFNNNRYLTCGVDSTIPGQLFLWNCVDELPAEKTIYRSLNSNPSVKYRNQHIRKSEHKMEYLILRKVHCRGDLHN